MFDITKVDKNFTVDTKINKEDIKFYSIDGAPFEIFGVFREGHKYRRLPEAVAKSVSDGVYALHANTAGGRVRFATDSPYIAINAVLENAAKMAHFTVCGSCGFDMYCDDRYTKTFAPPFGVSAGYEGICEFGTKKMREVTINFPLYTDVCNLYIGLADGSTLTAPAPYRGDKPVVYYGSSITQGGCASRPGMSYQAIVSRNTGRDYVNLGFSGSARAEDGIIEYIAGLEMGAFVFDYDFNSPSAEHLASTHERAFLKIREKHPELPVIFMSRPKHFLDSAELERRGIIEKTYKNALASGDKNVYFLDGSALTELCGDEGSVDGTHPTDFGFASIAAALTRVMKENNI